MDATFIPYFIAHHLDDREKEVAEHHRISGRPQCKLILRGGWSIHAARRGSDDALHNGITLNATWAKHRPTDSILLVFKGSRPPLPPSSSANKAAVDEGEEPGQHESSEEMGERERRT
jgi:hypothetical protein